MNIMLLHITQQVLVITNLHLQCFLSAISTIHV